MRIDLRADLEVHRRYARINLELVAQTQRNLLLNINARIDLIEAFREASHFLDNDGVGVGPWVLCEQIAQEKHGKTVSAREAAGILVELYRTWAHDAAEIALVVRTAALGIDAALSVSEIQAIERSIVWPSKPWNTSEGF